VAGTLLGAAGAYGLASDNFRAEAAALSHKKQAARDELARLADDMQRTADQMRRLADQMQQLIDQHRLRIEVPAAMMPARPAPAQLAPAPRPPIQPAAAMDPMEQYEQLKRQHQGLQRDLQGLKDRYRSIETGLGDLEGQAIERPSVFAGFGPALSGSSLASAAFPFLVASVAWTTGLVLITAGTCWLTLINRSAAKGAGQ
jgi:hypothetical protein